MDLLEIVNDLSRAAHFAKEAAAELPPCECDHQWLNPTFFVYRNGHREVGINFIAETSLKLAFKVAAEMFEAEEIGLIMDGTDALTHNKLGRHTMALGINRHGEMLWKVEPYLLTEGNRQPMWMGTEVPDKFPLADPWVAVEMHDIMKRNHKVVPPIMRDAFLSPHYGQEEIRAALDCAAGRAMEIGRARTDGIQKVSFFAVEGTPRAQVLVSSGIQHEVLDSW